MFSIKKILPLVSTFFFTGCSIYMAANKTGADIASVQKCSTRVQFINLGAKIISSERLSDGNLVEIYQIKAEQGSAVRAIMHGLLDLSTGFIWEIAGTPIEATMSKDQFITVKVTYGPGDTVLKAELV